MKNKMNDSTSRTGISGNSARQMRPAVWPCLLMIFATTLIVSVFPAQAVNLLVNPSF
jgi:hypothetical protein